MIDIVIRGGGSGIRVQPDRAYEVRRTSVRAVPDSGTVDASETAMMGTTADTAWVSVTVRGESLGTFRAFVFDLDGVVTDTTGLHRRAWQTIFDRHAVRFDSEIDYRKYLDGRPRFDATRDVLTARGISLPFGEPTDSPGTATVCALANAKNREFLRLVGIEGVRPYPSTVGLLRELRSAGIPTALVSSSMDCDTVTHAAGVADAFDVRLSGVEIRALGMPGKPHPGGFLEAARRLGVEPADAVVVEDAEAGVEAARRGEFGLVVGIDRSATGGRLDRFADVVVPDAGQLVLSWSAPA